MKIPSQFYKVCRVCGDKASGFNYSALTCESCKVFFLRNDSKKLLCPKEDNCEIDVATRKSCQKCRLDKCYKVGMRKLLNSQQQKQSQLSPKENHNPIETATDSTIQKTIIESEIDSTMRDMLKQEDEITSDKKLAFKSTTLETKIPIGTLSNHERALIDEVQKAMSVFEDENSLQIVAVARNVKEAISWPNFYGKRIVKFCKGISSFNLLKRSDQMIVLKNFIIEIFIVRTAFLKVPGRLGYPVYENETANGAMWIGPELGKNIQHRLRDILDINKKFSWNLHDEMENDSTIRDLIIAHLLFRPCEGISCPEFFGYQYSLYCQLLRKYLQHKYHNELMAKRKYRNLMNMMIKLEISKMNAKIICQQIDSKYLPEIILEVYNL